MNNNHILAPNSFHTRVEDPAVRKAVSDVAVAMKYDIAYDAEQALPVAEMSFVWVDLQTSRFSFCTEGSHNVNTSEQVSLGEFFGKLASPLVHELFEFELAGGVTVTFFNNGIVTFSQPVSSLNFNSMKSLVGQFRHHELKGDFTKQ